MSLTRPIVFTLDRRYLVALQGALRSLARALSADERVKVIVVHTDLSADDMRTLSSSRLNRELSIDFLHVEPVLPHASTGWVTPAVYLRLLLPQLLSKEAQVVYVDVDVLFRASPCPLLEMHLAPNVLVAAVQDVQNPTLGSGIALPGWASLGLPPEREYFNSGVMVMDLERWRTTRLGERAQEFIFDAPEHVRFWDQDALNYLANDNWMRLPLVWNCPPLSALLTIDGAEYFADELFPRQEVFEVEKSAALLHFMGPVKPWHDTFPSGWALEQYERLAW